MDEAETLRSIEVRRTDGERGVEGKGSWSRKEVGVRRELCDGLVGVPPGKPDNEGMLMDAGMAVGRVIPLSGKTCLREDDVTGASEAGLSVVECRLNVRSSHLSINNQHFSTDLGNFPTLLTHRDSGTLHPQQH